jgi:hypothetical protein
MACTPWCSPSLTHCLQHLVLSASDHVLLWPQLTSDISNGNSDQDEIDMEVRGPGPKAG